MNPVVHFEMPYGDKGRCADFYQKAFGWKMQLMGPEMGDYIVAQTDETDEKGMLKKTNRINGGFYKKMDEAAMNTPSVVIAVSDLDAALEKVKNAGGKTLREPMPIPGIGTYASIEDSEGNRVGVLQPATPM